MNLWKAVKKPFSTFRGQRKPQPQSRAVARPDRFEPTRREPIVLKPVEAPALEPSGPEGLAMSSIMLRQGAQTSWDGLEADTRDGASVVGVAQGPVRVVVAQADGEGSITYVGARKLVGTELSGAVLDAGVATIEGEDGGTETRPALSLDARGSQELGTGDASWRASGNVQASVLPGASEAGFGRSKLRVTAAGELERWEHATQGERLQVSVASREGHLAITGVAASLRGEHALHKAPQVPRDLVIGGEVGVVSRADVSGALQTGLAARLDLKGRWKQTFVEVETSVHGELSGAPMGVRVEVEQKLDGRRSVIGGYDSGGSRSRDPFEIRADALTKPRGAFVGLKWKW